MQYLVLILIILVCALVYIHNEQPALWNQGLVALKVPGDFPADTNAAPVETNAAPLKTNADTATAPAVPPASPVPAVPSTLPEVISPMSTHINPDHVRPVMQPGESPASTTNAPDTNAAAANAPTSNSPAASP
jgi:hypothetical protein